MVIVRLLTARFRIGSATNKAKARSDRVAKVVCIGVPDEALLLMGMVVEVGRIEKKRAMGMEMTSPSE